jgi:hypothetical protein
MLKMSLNSLTIQVNTSSLEHLINVETLLSLVYIILFLKTMKILIKFAKAQDSLVEIFKYMIEFITSILVIKDKK